MLEWIIMLVWVYNIGCCNIVYRMLTCHIKSQESEQFFWLISKSWQCTICSYDNCLWMMLLKKFISKMIIMWNRCCFITKAIKHGKNSPVKISGHRGYCKGGWNFKTPISKRMKSLFQTWQDPKIPYTLAHSLKCQIHTCLFSKIPILHLISEIQILKGMWSQDPNFFNWDPKIPNSPFSVLHDFPQFLNPRVQFSWWAHILHLAYVWVDWTKCHYTEKIMELERHSYT